MDKIYLNDEGRIVFPITPHNCGKFLMAISLSAGGNIDGLNTRIDTWDNVTYFLIKVIPSEKSKRGLLPGYTTEDAIISFMQINSEENLEDLNFLG